MGSSSNGSKSKSAAPKKAGSPSTAKIVLWVGVAIAVAAVAFLLFKPAGGGGIMNVDGAGVDKARAAGAQVIDVRSAGEYELGRIPGAVNVPVDTLQTAAANWDRNADYVVYCATGARSAAAIQTMQAMGFKNIKHLADGIQVYQGQLEKGSAGATQKIETAGKPVFVEFYTDS